MCDGKQGKRHAAKGLGPESNPGPLQSLGTLDARTTNWAKRHPIIIISGFFARFYLLQAELTRALTLDSPDLGLPGLSSFFRRWFCCFFGFF